MKFHPHSAGTSRQVPFKLFSYKQWVATLILVSSHFVRATAQHRNITNFFAIIQKIVLK